MFQRMLQFGFVFIAILVLLPTPVLAGSANDPEIISRPNTSAQLRGDVIPHLEITKGWIEADRSGDVDRFRFVLELASLPPLEDIPKDSVYVFHYTLAETGRLYFRANWSADQSTFETYGGMYAGCRAGVCPPFDEQGNRNYFYMPGDPSQHVALRSEVISGAPGRIVWSFPMEAYVSAERLHGLEMKGLFAATYTVTETGALRYADVALSVRDYQYRVSTSWSEQLFAQLPGPSPLLVVVAATGLLATLTNRVRKRRDDLE